MAKTSAKIYFPSLQRVTQIDNSHCGPAVLQMLYSNLGISVRQMDIPEAAGVEDKIYENGMSLTDMARAVESLLDGFDFWYKNNATMSDIDILLSRHFPVGVEWRGDFLEYSDGDYGHYSIVTHIDYKNKKIYLVDPYKPFSGEDRIFDIKWFENLWWDTNEVVDKNTGNTITVLDHRSCFVITNGINTASLENIDMQKGKELYLPNTVVKRAE